MQKNYFKLLLVTIGLMISLAANAYDLNVDNIYYNIISLDELTLEVTKGDASFNSYTGDVTIPETLEYKGKYFTVVKIGDFAFHQCPNVTAVAIPNSVISIGDGVFNGCTSLEKLIIGSGLSSMGGSVFYNCKSIAEITVSPENMTYMTEDNILYNKDKSKLILATRALDGMFIIPRSVIYIDEYAFSNCTKLSSLVIPANVSEIGNYAFDSCSGLNELKIEDSDETLKISAYSKIEECPIKKAYIGRNINSSNSYRGGLFNGNKKLESAEFGNKVTFIESSTFNSCVKLSNLILGSNIETIGDYAFSSCESLISIQFPSSLKIIDDHAFFQCKGFKEVFLPQGLEVIKESAFYSCFNLEKINIPGTVKSVGRELFYQCSKLKTLIIEDSNEELKVDYNLDAWAYGESSFYKASLDSLYLGRNIKINKNYSKGIFKSVIILTIGRDVSCIDGLFKECNKIEKVMSKITEPFETAQDAFATNTYVDAILFVPTGTLSKYHQTNPWKCFFEINEDAMLLGISALYNNSSCEKVYTINGRKTETKRKGINIIKKSNGTTKIVIIK